MTATERIASWLQDLAFDRFREHGPMDARGAALWDAGAALREGRGPEIEHDNSAFFMGAGTPEPDHNGERGAR